MLIVNGESDHSLGRSARILRGHSQVKTGHNQRRHVHGSPQAARQIQGSCGLRRMRSCHRISKKRTCGWTRVDMNFISPGKISSMSRMRRDSSERRATFEFVILQIDAIFSRHIRHITRFPDVFPVKSLDPERCSFTAPLAHNIP